MINMYFYMKIAISLFNIISKYTPKRISHKCFQKISSQQLADNKRVSKLFNFIYKMVILEKILKTKSDPIIHQNAPFCTIPRGYAPEPP